MSPYARERVETSKALPKAPPRRDAAAAGNALPDSMVLRKGPQASQLREAYRLALIEDLIIRACTVYVHSTLHAVAVTTASRSVFAVFLFLAPLTFILTAHVHSPLPTPRMKQFWILARARHGATLHEPGGEIYLLHPYTPTR